MLVPVVLVPLIFHGRARSRYRSSASSLESFDSFHSDDSPRDRRLPQKPSTIIRQHAIDNIFKGLPPKGGSRRRPSRKYKKSKRVLRRKSRSTRRR